MLVTSPKKKVHKLSGKLVRQFSGDVNALITDDEEDEEYVEEIVEEDTEEDSVEEIISSSEEEDDDDEERDSDDDDVELESIEDDETTGMIDDGTDESGSEFDPLPPPIHIPDALKPPHLRAKEKPQSYYDDYDDDSSIDDDGEGSFLSPSSHECDWKLPNQTSNAYGVYGIGCDAAMSISRLNLGKRHFV